MNKKNKFMLGVLLVFLLSCISIVGIKIGIYVMKPDAFVSLAKMKMEINATGFDGVSKAEVVVTGTPGILEIKDKKKESEIREAINKYQVNLSKKDNVKNGEVLKASLEFPLAKDFKIQYDMENFEVEKMVEGLPDLVKNFQDVKKYKEQMDSDAREKLIASYVLSDVDNPVIGEVAAYEKRITGDMLKDEKVEYDKLGETYHLNLLYKVMGKKKSFYSGKVERFEKYALVAFKSFKKKGDDFDYEINSVHIYADGERLENIEKIYADSGLEKVSSN